MIVAERLQEYNYESHQWFNKAELQGGLFAEAQEAYCVCFPGKAASAVYAT